MKKSIRKKVVLKMVAELDFLALFFTKLKTAIQGDRNFKKQVRHFVVHTFFYKFPCVTYVW